MLSRSKATVPEINIPFRRIDPMILFISSFPTSTKSKLLWAYFDSIIPSKTLKPKMYIFLPKQHIIHLLFSLDWLLIIQFYYRPDYYVESLRSIIVRVIALWVVFYGTKWQIYVSSFTQESYNWSHPKPGNMKKCAVIEEFFIQLIWYVSKLSHAGLPST